MLKKSLSLFLVLAFTFVASIYAEPDPLPSWTDGVIKKALIQFVKETTDKNNPNFVPPEERIATFDQDGTLWIEQPIYTQMMFILERIKILAPSHPEWNTQEPFKSILTDNFEAMRHFTEPDVEKIVLVTHAGMSVEGYLETVRNWLKTAVHPKYKKPYTEMIYQPMLEVLEYFSANGFSNFIVSGGGQEFIRAYADKVYKIPSEKIIGSVGSTKYEYLNGQPILLKLPHILVEDNYQGKPESINMFIGKRPIAAFGNSNGDRQMLEWTQAGAGKRIELLVHHDDAAREYAYGADSKVGTFSHELMEEAKGHGWHVISMKDDWKVIFSWEKQP